MIRFKAITDNDIDFFVDTFNEEGNIHWMKQDVPCEAHHVKQKINSDSEVWAVIWYKDGGSFVKAGLLCVSNINGDVYLGIIVKSDYRRNGICRESFDYIHKELASSYPITYIKVFEDHYMLDFYQSIGYYPTGNIEMKGRKLLEMIRDGEKKNN